MKRWLLYFVRCLHINFSCVCVCVCRLADLLSDCVEAQGHLDSLSTQVRSHLYLSQSLDPVLMETGRRG